MKWQPISTAPKDGTLVLGAVAGAQIPAIIKWVITPRSGKWVAGNEDDFDSLDDWSDYVASHDFPATHWQPLPSPPEEET
jgi:hypothetical protein